MKKLLFPILLTLCCSACFLSCKKKEYTCQFRHYYLRPLGIAFTGFSTSDLDTIIRLRYSGGSNLTDLLSADTFINADSSFFLEGDALFLKHDSSTAGYFWLLEDQIDYRVILPSVNRSYTITGTSKGPEYDTFQEEEPCRNREDVSTLVNTHVDGKPVAPSGPSIDPVFHYIFLEK